MSTHLFLSPQLGRYGFAEGHPLSVDRQGAFWRGACARGLDRRVTLAHSPEAPKKAIRRFHTMEYIDCVIAASRRGSGYLDYGDTPAFPGCYEIAAHVVGAALEGARRIMAGEARRCFQPIGGLHHARRAGAAGFCVFNDPGILIEPLRAEHGVRRVAYVDIDVHHGDSGLHEFEGRPRRGLRRHSPRTVSFFIPAPAWRSRDGRRSGRRPAQPAARTGVGRSRVSAPGRTPSGSSTGRGRSSDPAVRRRRSPATRSPTFASQRPRMPMPRGASSRSPSAMPAAG